MSKLIFCTVNLPLARLIDWYTVGYGHAALMLDNGNWLDARGSGVKERPPEENLYKSEVVELPYDIEPGMRRLVGLGYNFKGVIAQFLHFRWSGHGAMFCDQALYAASRLVGHPVIVTGREDKSSPIACADVFKAYVRGLQRG